MLSFLLLKSYWELPTFGLLSSLAPVVFPLQALPTVKLDTLLSHLSGFEIPSAQFP